MKTALVTGAAGFVGRHLVPKLVANGYIAMIVDPKINNVDFQQWAEVTHRSDFTYDLVIHLAANIQNIDARMRGGIRQFEDIVLDWEMANWVEQHKPKCFIAMSSCAVDYPDDPYCIVKRSLEALATTLHKNGQNVKILRPFSGYGGDQTQEYPFPAILGRAIRHEDPLTVWGGAQVRDWLHIDDLVSGIMYSIDNFPSGEPVELGTAIGTDFIQLAHKMADAVGYRPAVKGDKTKASSSAYRVAKLNNPYGWTPTITIEEGIKAELAKLIVKQTI